MDRKSKKDLYFWLFIVFFSIFFGGMFLVKYNQYLFAVTELSSALIMVIFVILFAKAQKKSI
jgi:hypothetical protein